MEKAAKPGLFALCLAPIAVLLFAALQGRLGPDPAEALMQASGEWTLRLLLLTLLVSPMRHWTGWSVLLRYRRMLGLFVFFYASLHLGVFVQFYLGWSVAGLLEELAERPYITAGFASWVMLAPLALTSTRGMQRRLGRNWARLHRLVYVAGFAACLHLAWQARSDIGEALLYSAAMALLLTWRWRRHSVAGRSGASLPGRGPTL